MEGLLLRLVTKKLRRLSLARARSAGERGWEQGSEGRQMSSGPGGGMSMAGKSSESTVSHKPLSVPELPLVTPPMQNLTSASSIQGKAREDESKQIPSDTFLFKERR